MIIGIIVIALAVCFCFLLAVANYSGEKFYEKYDELNKMRPSVPLASVDFVTLLNKKHFGGNLQISLRKQRASDAYADNVLFLSQDTLAFNTLASLTIISHELGHARQDIEGNKLKKIAVFRTIGRVIGLFMMPLLLAGGILMLVGETTFWIGVGLACGGLLIFFIALILKLRVISIEKEASKYAVEFLSEFLPVDDVKVCKKFLNDARQTYWADFLRTLLGWTMLARKNKLFN